MALLLTAIHCPPQSASTTPALVPATALAPEPNAATASSSNPVPTAPVPSERPSPDGTECGELQCRRFATAAQAFAAVLASQPLALGIGDAHALAGTEALAPTVRRFADDLLPLLAAPVAA